ncbi:hypothetical protein CsatA_018708 [Cannabis sativa]
MSSGKRNVDEDDKSVAKRTKASDKGKKVVTNEEQSINNSLERALQRLLEKKASIIAGKITAKEKIKEPIVESDNDEDRCRVQCRCSPERLREIVIGLNEAQKKVISDKGFGSLLNPEIPSVRSSLIWYLYNHMDLEKFELVQHGVIYPFTIQSFKEIMKIEDGGEDINFEDYVDIDNKVRNEVCNLEKSIKCTDLVELITNSKEADVLFVARFMLVALGSFLVPTSGTYVRKEYINALLDVGRIKKLNWASFIFKFLHENLKAHQKRLNNSKDKGKVHYLPGCTIYLQIYYWSHIKRKLYTSPRLGLPMAYWNEDRVKGISSFISKSGGFVNGKIILHPPMFRKTYGHTEDTSIPLSNQGGTSSSTCCNCILRDEMKERDKKLDTTCQELLRLFDSFKVDISKDIGKGFVTMKQSIIDEVKESFIPELREAILPEVRKSVTAELHQTVMKELRQSVLMELRQSLLKELMEVIDKDGERNDEEADKEMMEVSDKDGERDDEEADKETSSMSTSNEDQFENENTRNLEFDNPPTNNQYEVGPVDLTMVEDIGHEGQCTSAIKVLLASNAYQKTEKRFHSSKELYVDTFQLKEPASEIEFKLAMFVFGKNFDKGYPFVKFQKLELFRQQLLCLKPGMEITDSVISCYAHLLTLKEREAAPDGVPKYWFMPCRVSMCVPVICKTKTPHWFMCDIDMLASKAFIWDSLKTPRGKDLKDFRVRAASEMLRTLDDLLQVDMALELGEKFNFASLPLDYARRVPQQDNGVDCGVYVMKFMEHFFNRGNVAEIDVEHVTSQDRFNIMMNLIQHPKNECRATVLADVAEMYSVNNVLDVPPSTLVHTDKELVIKSPEKSPVDPRFKSKKSRAKNMVPSSSTKSRKRMSSGSNLTMRDLVGDNE